MKWLVLSDSHGLGGVLYDIFDNHSDVDGLFFLGDGLRDLEYVKSVYPNLQVCAVSGNCDMEDCVAEGLADCGGVRVFYTHGHMYGVKSALRPLCKHAKEVGAAVALYGHTHRAMCAVQDGVLLANPGAVSSYPAQYGILTVENGTPCFEPCQMEMK